MESLPHSVIAAGWIPFIIVSALVLMISTLFVLWYRSSRPTERAPGSSVIAVLGLSLALITSLLVPVDVFLVSFMKNSDGSWKHWAQDESVRSQVKESIMWFYYVTYSSFLAFAFLIIPANFFYHGLPLQDDEGEDTSCGKKLCHSIKFTLLSCFLFGLLVVAGVFLPFNGSPPSTDSVWHKFEWFFEELEENKGRDLGVFLLNVLSSIGMVLLVIYTGCGLSRLPASLLGSGNGVRTQLTGVERRVAEIDSNIRDIQARSEGREIGRFEQGQIERLEQQARLLRREQRDLEQTARTLVNRCKLICRPAQVGVGVVLALLSLLLCLSLLLTGVDKALHSSYTTGYSLQNSSLPNPLDILLVAAQQVFPLDYILYTALVLFLVSCSTTGLTGLGIRCCCLLVWRIRAWKTSPRGLLLAILILMYIIIAQNVVLYSLVPDYTMFGNQHYNQTTDDAWQIVRCRVTNIMETKDVCVPSCFSLLLLAFHSKTWIFGFCYFWLTWGLLVSAILGCLHAILVCCTTRDIPEMEEDLLEQEEEETSWNPFD